MKLKPRFTTNVTAILLVEDLVAEKGSYLLVDHETDTVVTMTASEGERFFVPEGEPWNNQSAPKTKAEKIPSTKGKIFRKTLRVFASLSGEHPKPLTSEDVARLMGNSMGKATGTLTRLTRAGMISHAVIMSPTARRGIFAHSLTPKGEKLLQEILASDA